MMAPLVRFILAASLATVAVADFAPRPRDARPTLLALNSQHRRENTLLGLRGGQAVEVVEEVTPPHALSVRDFLDREGVSPEQGLSQARAEQLLKLHGPNALEVEGADPLWKLFLAQFDDRLVQILLCVAALSYALAYFEGEANGWVEPAVILGILLLNAFVGTWQEASASAALDALQKMQPSQARCVRDGQWLHDMNAADLVPGDVIELRVGDRVPADARMISLSTTTLSADEVRNLPTSPSLHDISHLVLACACLLRCCRARSRGSRLRWARCLRRWRPMRASRTRRTSSLQVRPLLTSLLTRPDLI